MMQVSLSVTGLQVKTPALEAATVLLSGPIEFELKSGEINVIRGGNGVGKSTLLRLMSNALPGQGILFKPEFGLQAQNDALQKILLGRNPCRTRAASKLPIT